MFILSGRHNVFKRRKNTSRSEYNQNEIPYKTPFGNKINKEGKELASSTLISFNFAHVWF
jgi:hypothetical protein